MQDLVSKADSTLSTKSLLRAAAALFIRLSIEKVSTCSRREIVTVYFRHSRGRQIILREPLGEAWGPKSVACTFVAILVDATRDSVKRDIF